MRVACLWFQNKIAAVKVAESCLRFSPQICLRGDQAVFIEIGKCHRLYSEDGFRARVMVVLRRLGVEASIGIGSDIPQALLIAKYRRHDTDNLPLEALVDVMDPFNKDFIGQKYVYKMIAAFTDLGVKNIGQFKRIPAGELTSRFGAIGIMCRERALNAEAMSWPLWRPEEIIQEKTEFSYFDFYGELEPLLFELKKHLDHIFERLSARGLKAQQMQVKVFCETNSLQPNPIREFNFDFLYPQGATKGTLTVIRERLTRDFEKKPVRTPIQGIQTTVIKSVLGSPGQKNIFHNQEEVNEQLHALLNQLSESHGKENIFQAQLTEDRRPEKSWRKVDVATQQAANAGGGSNSSSGGSGSNGSSGGRKKIKPQEKISIEGRIPLRPTYLMKPEPVQILAGCISIRRQRYRIAHFSAQIERISGGWFETPTDLNDSYDRNYYQVELENGTKISVFETPQKQFFIHGYFG